MPKPDDHDGFYMDRFPGFIIECQECKSKNVALKNVILATDDPEDPDTSIDLVCNDCGNSIALFED